MKREDYHRITPDYVDRLLPGQIFVFGSNSLGYHTGGASRMAYKKFGAVWGQAEGIQGQSYAIPTDFGGMSATTDLKPYVDRFIAYAKAHPENLFLVTRVGCGISGHTEQEMASYFKEAVKLKNILLPRGFADILIEEDVLYDLERFLTSQNGGYADYQRAFSEIKAGRKLSHWIWYVFPQIKGLGFSYNSEYYGISGLEEAKAYLNHPVLGARLREISEAFLNLNAGSALDILGRPDDLKVRSCMTLFDMVSEHDIFEQVITKYYYGERCPKTLLRLKPSAPHLERLTITKDYRILIGDGNEIVLEPLMKCVYLLYLKHPEGIAFKTLTDYKQELTDIYVKLKPNGLTDKVQRSIEDLTNPLNNSINEKCARIHAAIISVLPESMAQHYYISGKKGEVRRIYLNRNLVTWE